jgi:dTMP kinase
MFIVFEGPHGCGKTTQARLLQSRFDDIGVSSVYTKEPYDSDLKTMIEKCLARESRDAGYLLLLLHAADRYIHTEFIVSMLELGKVVICDRYLLSSCVYQQMQGVPLSFIEQVNSFCRRPDITFQFRVPLSTRRERLAQGGRHRNNSFFSERNLQAEEILYEELMPIYRERGWRVVSVDGNDERDKVASRIASAVSDS